MRELLFIAVILACPLLMILMMRGGHGHGGSGHSLGGCGHDHSAPSSDPTSTAELRGERDELERLIEEREAEEAEPTPVGGGRR